MRTHQGTPGLGGREDQVRPGAQAVWVQPACEGGPGVGRSKGTCVEKPLFCWLLGSLMPSVNHFLQHGGFSHLMLKSCEPLMPASASSWAGRQQPPASLGRGSDRRGGSGSPFWERALPWICQTSSAPSAFSFHPKKWDIWPECHEGPTELWGSSGKGWDGWGEASGERRSVPPGPPSWSPHIRPRSSTGFEAVAATG